MRLSLYAEAGMLKHAVDSWTPYARRNATLRGMGYTSYADYLASPLWKSIRKRVLSKAKYKCHICRGGATQVHHRSYSRDTLEGRWLSHMNAICRDCHRSGELDDIGKKVPLRLVNKRLTVLRKPRAGQCACCKMNPVRLGHDLCGKCKKAIHGKAFLAPGKNADGSERRSWDEMSKGQRRRARKKAI